jgi:hypothetical protein
MMLPLDARQERVWFPAKWKTRSILGAPRVALVGLLLIAAGIPVYALCHKSSSVGCELRPKEVAAD